MGVENENDEQNAGASLQAVEGDATMLPTTPPTRNGGYIPPEDNQLPRVERADQPVLTSGSRISLVVITIVLAVFIIASTRPLYTLLFVILALLPAFPIIYFIRTRFQDNAVGWTYLLNQLLIGASSLVFVTMMLESLLTVAIGSLIFMNDSRAVTLALNAEPEAGEDTESEEYIADLLQSVPLWKMILFFLLIAYITTGMVEEVAKWILARRYRKVDEENAQVDATSTVRIGCKGILAIACMGSLGFAAMENMGYVLAIAFSIRTGFSFKIVEISLLRGLLAYPLHVGTQFFVALSAAQWHVFKERSSVMFALLVAILFHGTFDGVALIGMVLIAAKIIPGWAGYLIPVFDFLLIGFLLLICRARYKGLLERERLVLTQDPV